MRSEVSFFLVFQTFQTVWADRLKLRTSGFQIILDGEIWASDKANLGSGRDHLGIGLRADPSRADPMGWQSRLLQHDPLSFSNWNSLALGVHFICVHTTYESAFPNFFCSVADHVLIMPMVHVGAELCLFVTFIICGKLPEANPRFGQRHLTAVTSLRNSAKGEDLSNDRFWSAFPETSSNTEKRHSQH